MKCLLTGATGFIGSHLVESLLSHHHEVHIIDINEKFYFEHPDLHIVKADINNNGSSRKSVGKLIRIEQYRMASDKGERAFL